MRHLGCGPPTRCPGIGDRKAGDSPPGNVK